MFLEVYEGVGVLQNDVLDSPELGKGLPQVLVPRSFGKLGDIDLSKRLRILIPLVLVALTTSAVSASTSVSRAPVSSF